MTAKFPQSARNAKPKGMIQRMSDESSKTFTPRSQDPNPIKVKELRTDKNSDAGDNDPAFFGKSDDQLEELIEKSGAGDSDFD